MITYLQVQIKTDKNKFELLEAELAEINFEGFWEENPGNLYAYIDESLFNKEDFIYICEKYDINIDQVSYSIMPNINWNEEWEKNYDAVNIGHKVRIRAPFHNTLAGYEHEIIIKPQMSFGTGHHGTTSGIIKLMDKENIEGKKVADIGCGTGILAIYAEKIGAKEIWAIDNEDWAYENTLENIGLNSCQKIMVEKGDAENIRGKNFDIIISNITKNINLKLIPLYAESIVKGGYLYLSGFFDSDLEEIDQLAKKFNFILKRNIVHDNWCAIEYVKS